MTSFEIKSFVHGNQMLFIGKGAYTPGNGNRDDDSDSETSIFKHSLKVRMQNGNHIISSVVCIKMPTAFMVNKSAAGIA